MAQITRDKVWELIAIAEGENEAFGVTFIKKDGSLRRMSCKLGVKREVTGKGMSWNPIQRGMLPVFDLNAPPSKNAPLDEDGNPKRGAWRMINVNTMQSLTVDGVTYEVV